MNGGNIGNIPRGKHLEYTDLCHEKLRRIFINRELTSLQSANPAKKQDDGAIQVNDNLYISIHELPEGLNQEFAMLVAVAARELDSRMYVAILILA